MALTFSTGKTPRDSEVRFWTLLAVVMAMPSAHGVQMVLCTSGMDSQPIVDKLIVKSPIKKPGLAGLKCAQCVLASITAITTPQPVFRPAVYTILHADFTPSSRQSPIKARAPPRPHSCGPPSEI